MYWGPVDPPRPLPYPPSKQRVWKSPVNRELLGGFWNFLKELLFGI